eukprot:GHVU01232093.1.p1 GENE.GHVU01232093.1~~GHVU01232093.1.p1  ORF type:complete len:100 (-),score=3.31 GHVU01232093.1:85-384(-)
MDQNMELKKINNHASTSDFLDINLNNSIIPTILRPTRITHSSATLIDNIYISQNLSKKYKSGIIITDISDHFPCFTMICNTKYLKKRPCGAQNQKNKYK